MDAPLIATSARKHSIPDGDVIYPFNHPMLLDDGFTMLRVGADTAGNALESGRRRQ